MENLKLTRIDFRLIHGQVMTRWVKKYDINHIIVIDDKTAKSSILKKIILNAAPSSIEAEVLTISEAVERWQGEGLSQKRLLVLFKDVSSAVAAWNEGVKYEELQIGGIEGSANKKTILRNVVMAEEEMLALEPLHEAGVAIYVQPIPENSTVKFNEIKKKF